MKDNVRKKIHDLINKNRVEPSLEKPNLKAQLEASRMTCLICDKQVKDVYFGTHLLKAHEVSLKDYIYTLYKPSSSEE